MTEAVAIPSTVDALSRERITATAKRMGLTINSDEQFAFLQARGPVHLQAAPGSGKTTLVALKLILLAQDWRPTIQGICVLSHTNTATEEITARLVGTAGERLLRYPHFIGTIQSFVHTFVAMPALHSVGVVPRAIDDHVYATHAERLLRVTTFRDLRAYLSRRTNGVETVTQATYAFEQDQPKLQIPGTRFGRGTKSYKQLLTLKGWLAGAGVYRYKDMYAIAAQRLNHHPRLIPGMRHRFPFVLIDEMQDTDSAQQALLHAIFGDAVAVQCVGDVNQGIFNRGPGDAAAFPIGNVLELPASQRFGPDIARVANRLAIKRPQAILGHGPHGTLAVITFTADTIHHVVPKFEELVHRSIPPEAIAAHPPKILGAREERGDSKLFPRALGCYLPQVSAESPETPCNPVLNGYRAGKDLVHRDQHVRPATILLWDAIRDAVWDQQAHTGFGRVPARLPALTELDRHTPSPGHRIRGLLAKALTNDYDDPDSWEQFTGILAETMTELPDLQAVSVLQLNRILATYTARPADAPVRQRLVVSTTARAKGETHCATLVLECVNAKGTDHDLGPLLPVIAGASPASTIRKTARDSALNAFVATTRPQHLLVLAIHADRVLPYRQLLERDGWLIIEA